MDSIDKQNNVKRAKMLFELFPDEIPAFITFMRVTVGKILNNDEELRENWEGRLITVEFWQNLSVKANKTIAKYGQRLETRSKLFSDQLFDGYDAMLSVYCLNRYKRAANNQRFIKAIDVFFPLE